MITRAIRTALHQAGYDIHRLPTKPPCWGYERPAHRQLQSLLEKERPVFEAALGEILSQQEALKKIALEPSTSGEPHWRNNYCTALDAAALVAFVLSRRPARYVEIGSGNSTAFTRFAVRLGGLSTSVTSIDPRPRIDINSLCDTVVRERLENVDLSIFDDVEPGDIVFYDGSHRAAMNSDTVVFYLEVLPRLKPGVIVQVHDIFLPYDYPPAWRPRRYSEQYLLAGMLLSEPRRIRPLLASAFVSAHPDLGEAARAILGWPGSAVPFYYDEAIGLTAVSSWFVIG